MVADEKTPSQKPNIENDNDNDDAVSTVDAKPAKTGSEKQRQELDKKASNKAVVLGNGKEAEDGKVPESIKNCFINCTYLSDKNPEARPLRRVAKDSGSLDDKDAQSSTSKESDDSQVLVHHRAVSQC